VFPVFLNVGAGLLMFLLVTVFLHAARSRAPRSAPPGEPLELQSFINQKKFIALALTVMLLLLAAYNLFVFASWVYEAVYLGESARIDPNMFFYTDVFAVMIFTDVLLVILSLADSYELVFRNAAFVISTILLRFSLTVARPYGAVMALSAMIFGVLTLLIYDYHLGISKPAP
jgi:hypothetical protein